MPAKKKSAKKTTKKPAKKKAAVKKASRRPAAKPAAKARLKNAAQKAAAKTGAAAKKAVGKGKKPQGAPSSTSAGAPKVQKTAGIGTVLSDRAVQLTDGSQAKISSLAGPRGLVLYFYPKDQTPGCTKEACDFRDNHTRLKSLGFGVAGVSPDSAKSHQNFTAKQSLNFPLIADTDKKLCEELGVWQEKSLYGRAYMGVMRTTFVLSPDLKVTRVYENVKVDGHVGSILNDLASA